jgi:P pilus assembly protein, pilin FimA
MVEAVQVQTTTKIRNNVMRRRLAWRSGWGQALALLLSALFGTNLAQAGVPAPVTVTYTVTTQAPTCSVALPPNGRVELNPVTTSDFSTSPVTKGGVTFAVTLSGCTGNPTTGTVPNLTFWGTADGTQTTLFKNMATTGAAGGVGFVLLKGTTSAGTTLAVGTSSSRTAIPVTLSGGTGKVDFFAMPSRGTHPVSAVTGGAMSTSLNFNMDYR